MNTAMKTNGHAPGHLRNAFDATVETFSSLSPDDFIEDADMTVRQLCEVLAGCTDIMPGSTADEVFDCERDVTFADGASVPDRTYGSGAKFVLERLE